MDKPSFTFKQFSVYDSHCGMKVGTDGVVLGAWANCEGASHVIDVGSGSGLIALMIAQRTKVAYIDAVEIDEDACLDLQQNVRLSPWSDRINVIRSNFSFCNNIAPADLIVSNPPFFTEGLRSPLSVRATARHCGELNFASLIELAAYVLSDNGRLAFIHPSGHDDEIIYQAEMARLKLRRICRLSPSEGKAPVRVLYEFCRIDGPIERSELAIRRNDWRTYTPAFSQICGDFYLDM